MSADDPVSGVVDESPATDVSTDPTAGPPEPASFDWLPLYDKILVRREKPKETYDAGGSIVVADVHQQTQNRGTVIAVGEGRLNMTYGTPVPLKVHVGMEVLFGKHSGIDMEDAPDLVMLREDELLAYRMPAGDNDY